MTDKTFDLKQVIQQQADRESEWSWAQNSADTPIPKFVKPPKVAKQYIKRFILGLKP